jgi:membrane fusion protein, multidrug efflux system
LRQAKDPRFVQEGRQTEVTIARVAPVVNARAQTREVVLRASDPLVPGAAGELIWSATTPYLPAAYLQQYQNRLGIWVEEGGKPVFKPVPSAQTGRPVLLDWPLSTRIIDEGRFALATPAANGQR